MPWIPCPHNPKKLCADCKKKRKQAADKANYQKSKDKIKSNVKTWGENNPEKVKASKKKYQKHGARVKKGMIFAPGQSYDTMILEQDNRCLLCHELFGESANEMAVVDHCHITGAVRGLLHRRCNLGIGMLRDSALLCLNAAEYLLTSTTNTPSNE